MATKKAVAAKTVQETISEVELASYLTKREQLTALNAQVKALKSDVDGSEEALIAKLQRGATVIGKIKALIEFKLPACRPAWKEEFETLAGRLGLDPKEEVEAVQDVVKSKLKAEPHLKIEVPKAY